MASDENKDVAHRGSNQHLPDYIVNFVAFKREMVRLDYTAERLRKACREVEESRIQMQEGLRRQENQVTLRQQSCNQRRLQDDQKTLAIQTRAREAAERKRVLLSELEASRQLLEELGRKRAKLQHWLNGLEEHRVFLSEIIAHRVSPRTPLSTRRSTTSVTTTNMSNVLEDYGNDPVVEVMQSPGMIRSRLAHKERNVIAQSRLLFQACQLAEQVPGALRPGKDSILRIDNGENPQGITNSSSNWDQLNASRGTMATTTMGMQTGLSDANFATVHRLFRQFISPKSSSCDALGNFAAIERYAYFVLQMVDACDPAMLKKIIAKVVVDKRKTLEAQKLAKEAAHREERERKALANATSAPAVFKRVTVVPGRKYHHRRFRAEAAAGKAMLLRHSNSTGKESRDSSSQEIDTAQTDELLYLFRFQL